MKAKNYSSPAMEVRGSKLRTSILAGSTGGNSGGTVNDVPINVRNDFSTPASERPSVGDN